MADSDVGDNSPLEVWLTVMWVTQLTARGVADSDVVTQLTARGVADSDVGDTTHC